MKQNIEEIDFLKMAIGIGYSYLEGGCGLWTNSDNKTLSYDAMDNEYIKNCINFISRGIKEIHEGEIDYDIEQRIERAIDTKSKQVTDKDVDFAKNEILSILNSKKSELTEVLTKRNFK